MQLDIKNTYNDLRNIFLQTEIIQKSINKIKHKQLRDILTELLKTCQADLMILLDLVYQVEACESDTNISEIIDNFSELDEVVN